MHWPSAFPFPPFFSTHPAAPSNWNTRLGHTHISVTWAVNGIHIICRACTSQNEHGEVVNIPAIYVPVYRAIYLCAHNVCTVCCADVWSPWIRFWPHKAGYWSN